MPGDDVRGRLDAMILAAVERGPLHGYAVIAALEAVSGGRLQVATGTVYPALRRLERCGLLRGEWDVVGGRRRRTYRLTDAGVGELARERADWADFGRIIGAVLDQGA
jgi:DNA-binding PadR family transcriptional regulator